MAVQKSCITGNRHFGEAEQKGCLNIRNEEKGTSVTHISEMVEDYNGVREKRV